VKRVPAPYLRGIARLAKARELAQRIVIQGQPPLEAAHEMGLTRDQLYKILRGEPYKREIADLFAVVGEEKRGFATEAVRRLWGLVPQALDRTARIVEHSEDDAVALRAANSILDRTGLRPQGGDVQVQTVIVLTPEQAEALNEALRVAAQTIEVSALPSDPNKEQKE